MGFALKGVSWNLQEQASGVWRMLDGGLYDFLF